ncbi:MAG TPA: type VI secretion system baseplate subunit TssE [Rhodobacteraceae bacterium]|nr:type VI secretion system baseplate subunit TssE [Paracoccaceae bacterium]
MADLGDSERLQPSLLDRLTDNSPNEVKESARDQIIDIRQLRDIVLRDLGYLLNTVNQEGDVDEETFPFAAASTLNYGITDIAGKKAAEARPYELERMIHKAIERFEPRIVQGSLEVRLSTTVEGTHSRILFNIHAEIWAQPVPVEVFMRTELDLASGDMSVVKG